MYSIPQEKANLINNQFQSVFTQENISDIPTPDGPQLPDISDIDIITEGVDKVLTDVNVNKASGPDKIPNQLLKIWKSYEIAPVMQFI